MIFRVLALAGALFWNYQRTRDVCRPHHTRVRCFDELRPHKSLQTTGECRKLASILMTKIAATATTSIRVICNIPLLGLVIRTRMLCRMLHAAWYYRLNTQVKRIVCFCDAHRRYTHQYVEQCMFAAVTLHSGCMINVEFDKSSHIQSSRRRFRTNCVQ